MTLRLVFIVAALALLIRANSLTHRISQLYPPNFPKQMANPIIIAIPSADSCENVAALQELDAVETSSSERSTSDGSWSYQLLDEDDIVSHLASKANEIRNDTSASITFQPLSDDDNQDRRVMEEWTIADRTWFFDCVLDGHVNHHTVVHVAAHLPRMMHYALESCFADGHERTPEAISAALGSCVTALDVAMLEDFRTRFPIQEQAVTDESIRERLQEDRDVIFRCFGGCTVLACVSDAVKKDIWVVNLGDSYSALGTRQENDTESTWTARSLNSLHSVDASTTERARIFAEHPGEIPIENDRVLEYLQPTRSMGDFWMKMPAIYSTRVLTKFNEQWVIQSGLSRRIDKVRTPPYISNIPEVSYFKLPPSESFLLLASDGLDAPDFPDMDHQEALLHWVTVVGNSFSDTDPTPSLLPLLREVIGGENSTRVARSLTLDMPEKWLDDITVIARRFL